MIKFINKICKEIRNFWQRQSWDNLNDLLIRNFFVLVVSFFRVLLNFFLVPVQLGSNFTLFAFKNWFLMMRAKLIPVFSVAGTPCLTMFFTARRDRDVTRFFSCLILGKVEDLFLNTSGAESKSSSSLSCFLDAFFIAPPLSLVGTYILHPLRRT